MKTLLKSIVVCLLGASLVGCVQQTGFTFIDYDTAEANGIRVTKFTDNSFVANIEYDYSAVEDFQTTNLTVTLVKTVIPLDKWWGPNKDRSGYNKRQIRLQERLIELKTADDLPLYWYGDRPAIVKEHVPGKIKIFSFDDMGAYKLEYKKQ